MSKYDLVIKNGTIVDGTRSPRYTGDIGISDGVIKQISTNIPEGQAAETIDARGKIVAPGVIDSHTHYDAQLHWDPYCTSSSWHGVTTVVGGNCGFGFAPCKPDHQERYMLMMANTEQVPIDAQRTAMSWDWETFPQWMAHLKQMPIGINLAMYVPLNPLLIYVMGIEAAKSRTATPEEMQQMKDLLNEAMDHGAIGFAFSFHGDHNSHCDYDGTPMPTDIMDIEMVYELSEVLRKRGEGVIQANVSSPNADNRQVVEKLARRCGRPVIHNIVIVLDALPDYHKSLLIWLDEMDENGLPIYASSLTLRGWNEIKAYEFNVWDVMPAFREFSTCGDLNDKIAKVNDPKWQQRLKDEYTPKELMGAGGALETYLLSNTHGDEAYAKYEGQNLERIAAELGKPVVDLFLDILIATSLEADFVLAGQALSRNAQEVGEVIRHQRILPGNSDGGAHPKFWNGGHYSTDQIIWMTRETDEMSLEDLHAKLSFLPARTLGLHNRGLLLEGYAADLFVYDYDELGYQRDKYDVDSVLPNGDWRRVVYARGVDAVVVNGKQILKPGMEPTGMLPGEVVGCGAN